MTTVEATNAPATTGDGAEVHDGTFRVQRRYATEPLGYVDSLDGLRGYSMVVVMFYHARFTFFPGGFLAVSIFFTLSGFLITSLLLREWAADRAIDMRAFWSRRFRRLLPASWITLLGVVGLGVLGAWDGDQLTSLRGDIPASLLQVVNWHFIIENRTYGAGFTAPTPIEHYWSLAVEEQFYLFLPLIILGVMTLGRRRSFRHVLRVIGALLITLIALSATLNGWLARHSIDRAYFGTDTRMAEMLAGALLAVVMVRRLRWPEGPTKQILRLAGLMGIAAILALWMLGALRVQWMYPWGLLATAAATCAVIAGTLQGGIAARILAFKPAAVLGRMSYGTYLVHWPIFFLLSPARTGLAPWPLFALRFVVSVSISTLMFRYIEEPVRRRHILTGTRFVYAGAVLLPVILVATFFVTRGAEPTSIIQHDRPTGTVLPPAPPRRNVLVVGDQVAGTIARALGSLPADHNSTMSISASSSIATDCGLVSGGWLLLEDGTVERDVQRCFETARRWSADIEAVHPDVVLVVPSLRDASVRRSDPSTPWDSPPTDPTGTDFRSVEMGSTIDELNQVAQTVGATLLLASMPMSQQDPPSALPPREPLADPLQEHLRAAEEGKIVESAPQLATQPPLATRVANTNVIAAHVAQTRGLGFVDLAASLNDDAGTATTLDARSAAPAPSSTAAAAIFDSLARVIGAKTNLETPTIPVPDSLTTVTLPTAPAASPRVTVAPGERASILVLGDSVAYGLGYAIEAWAREHEATVTVAAQFGCPLARGGRFRFKDDSDVFGAECDWGADYPRFINQFRPQVVVVSSSVWQVVDRQLPGDSLYRHLGDELMDRYVLSEFLTAINVLTASGATVALLTAPRIEAGREKGYSGLPESDPARMDRLNEIIREAVDLRPGVTRLIDLAAWNASLPGGEMDVSRRPDGIHFTDAASAKIADWLGPQLMGIAVGSD